MEESPRGQVTQMLARARQGEESAVAALLPLVYGELRALAGSYFRKQASDHTLQPTALVHEAYVKLVGPTDAGWESRAHFFAVAAKAMRQILTDHARRKKAAKRGGAEERQKIALSRIDTPAPTEEFDLIALEEALGKLAQIDERQCSIVEMRFLAGLTVSEVAEVTHLSTATVEREWRMAKAWLRRELSGEAPA